MTRYEHSFVRIPVKSFGSGNKFKDLDDAVAGGWEIFDTQPELNMGTSVAYIFLVRREKKDK